MDMRQMDEIRARLEAIGNVTWTPSSYDAEEGFSPGDEEYSGGYSITGMNLIEYGDYVFYTQQDAEFIAHAPADVRALLDEVEEIARIRTAVATVADKLVDEGLLLAAMAIVEALKNPAAFLEDGK